jgi:hypothetical protein
MPGTLSHSVSEIDEKLKRIPLATSSESTWTRTVDWQYIADQSYDSSSLFAQSGVAVAQALSGLETTINDAVNTKLPKVDQEYNHNSENAQSGKAVAEAILSINIPTVDQEYIASSENAQSGKAVKQAIEQAIEQAFNDFSGNLTAIIETITDKAIKDMFSSN